MFDYRGYGQSTGRPSESGTYRDAEAAWRYLVEECRFAPREIILFGRSLGAAIAAHHFWYLPVRYLARFRYSTLDYIRCVDAPTLVIHSAEDDVVPIEQGRKIYDHAKGPKRFLSWALEEVPAGGRTGAAPRAPMLDCAPG